MAKNALARSFSLRPSGDGLRRSGYGAGQGLYTPRITLPYDLPGVGETITVPGNTLQDVKPSAFTTTQANYAGYNSYGFGVRNPWWGVCGGIMIGPHGGHLHPDFPCLWMWDEYTGQFSLLEHTNGGTIYGGANTDLGYNLSQTSGTPYYEITGSGHTPVPGHLYQNSSVIPPYLGGGPQGSLLLLGRGAIGETGDVHASSVHAFDCSTRRWRRLTDNLTARMTYECGVAFDAARGRYWYNTQGSHVDSFIPYLRASDWTFQNDASWSGLPPSQLGNGGRVWMLQGILFVQTNDNGLLSFDPSNPTAGVLPVTITGPAGSSLPSYRNQFVYSRRTGKLYWIGVGGGTTLNRLTPAGNIRTGSWYHDTTTVSPGLTAQTDIGDPPDAENPLGKAQHYTALQYAESSECLAWFPGGTNPVQLANPS